MKVERRMFAARGAIQVESDSRERMVEAVLTLFDRIVSDNTIEQQDMVCIQFTVTPDLRSMNPATALRSRDNSFPVPLFCMQEPVVDGMLERTIRLMVMFYADADHKVAHAYIGGAARLRSDIAGENR